MCRFFCIYIIRIIIKILEIIFIPFKFIKKLFFKPISFIFINIRKSFTNLYNNFYKFIKKNKNPENSVKN